VSLYLFAAEKLASPTGMLTRPLSLDVNLFAGYFMFIFADIPFFCTPY